MNCIANRTPLFKKADYYGDIDFNGVNFDKIDSGYVEQEDHLFGMLTVYETLWYASKFDGREDEKWIEEVMKMLGLIKVKDSIVGNDRTRGISGGEKKRLNIGVELMRRPKVLFLDEPTSGLDSF